MWEMCSQCLRKCECDCDGIHDEEWMCHDCMEKHIIIKKWICTDCGKEYFIKVDDLKSSLFGDDNNPKLCDGCGNNWVCNECNSLEMVNENGNDKYYCNDCNNDDDTFIDHVDFKMYYDNDRNEQENENMDIDDRLNDQHDYTTMFLFHPI